MRFVSMSVVLCLTLLSSGCAVFEKEKDNRGGYLDYLADEYLLKADSKKMRAMRAFAIEVSLARIASIDRQLMAIRIGATTARSGYVIACAYKKNPLNVPGSEKDPCFYFDSLMVDYSNALFDLAILALPVAEAKRLIDAVEGTIINPANIIQLLSALGEIGKQAVRYGRVVGGIYRDSQELEVQVWLNSPAADQDGIPAAYKITDATVARLREIYDRKNDDMLAWRAEIAALRQLGFEPVPQPKFFDELAGVLRHICGLITKETKPLDACTDGLPHLLPDPPVAGTPPKQVTLPGSFFANLQRKSAVRTAKKIEVGKDTLALSP